MSEISELDHRLASLEQEVAEMQGYGKRLHTFKNEILGKLHEHKSEITEMLGKHHEERKSLDGKFGTHYNAVAQQVNTQMQGLLRVESRINMLWNTLQGLYRFIEKVLAGDYPVPGASQQAQPHKECVPDFAPFWTTDAFSERIMEAGREVYRESMKHELAELERLKKEKAEKKAGKITSIESARARKPTPADVALSDNISCVAQGMSEHGSELEELRKLREEAAAEVPARKGASPLQELRANKITKSADGKSVTLDVPLDT